MANKRYDDKAFREFQKVLLKEKGSELQREILQNAKNYDGEKFINWMESLIADHAPNGEIFAGEDEPTIPDKPEKYTPQDFKNPTDQTIKVLWNSWRDINPGILCSPSVWGYIVSRFVKSGKLAPYALMVGGNGARTTGEREIDDALGKSGEQGKKAVDGCVRSFLRRLSGIHERGARSIYQDCPFAMAWWQCHIANEVSENTGEDNARILALFKEHSVWEKLSDKMASQLTVIGDKNIRDGLILFLLENENHRGKDKIDALMKSIGVMSAWRALGFFSPEKVKGIITNEII